MKVVILAGGLGTRLSEETEVKPKPMVEIGGKPMLWHIMNIYAAYGFNEFIIALGYKGDVVKDYFLNFFSLNNDLTVDVGNGNVTVHDRKSPEWKVHLIDTGLNTQTGGRIGRLRHLIGDETFMLTYGDGISDVNIGQIVDFHKSHGKYATVTAVRPPARFGGLVFDGEHVIEFTEKPQTGEGWINGGFFVLEPQVFGYINNGDDTYWEIGPLESLAEEGQLVAYKHDGFWQAMDTLRDKRLIESMWESGTAPWAVWGKDGR